MKAVYEKVPRAQWESFHCEVIRGDSYGSQWHFHPEFQLTLAERSQGFRLVGDHFAELRDGDLVLLGANLPHVWHQAEEAALPVHAVIVRFNETFAGGDLLAKPEMEPVRALLRRAARGLHVTGAARETAAAAMRQISASAGLTRLLALLNVLAALATAPAGELTPLASPEYEPVLKEEDLDRMERVCRHLHRHYTGRVERRQLAALAHLSEGAFSRFFHARTGRTVPQYVNELRVGRACRILVEQPHRTVSDIALDCGFDNLANFNRRFKAARGMTPSAFRDRSQKTLKGAAG